MQPPFDVYKTSIIFPSVGSVIGMFAGHKTALIRTDESSNAMEQAIENFPNAKFVVRVGSCYSLCKAKHKLGDVLVSKQVCKLKSKGENNIDKLFDLFWTNIPSLDHIEFKVPYPNTNTRYSATAYAGDIGVAEEMYDKFRVAMPEAIGVEIKGGEIHSVHDGVIMIKGVVGYGSRHEEKSWEFSASMAALAFAEDQLSYWQGKDLATKVCSK